MGLKSSKYSYNVEKVGQNVKSKEALRKSIDEKHLPVVANEMVIEEIISAVQKSDQAPRLSQEELKKEEDLILAMVRGEVIPSMEDSPNGDVTPKEDKKAYDANDLDAITVIKEEISESVPIVTVQNILEAEKAQSVPERNEEIDTFKSSKIDEITSINCINTHEEIEEVKTQSVEEHVEHTVNKEEILNSESAENSEIGQVTESKCSELQQTKEETQSADKIDNQEDKDKETTKNIDSKEEEHSESINTNDQLIAKEENQGVFLKEEVESQKELPEENKKVENQPEDFNKVENKEQDIPLEIENRKENQVCKDKENDKLEIAPKDVYLQEIIDIEKVINGLKEKILHFNGSAEDKEFSVLHEVLIKHIIKLDDITFDDEEVKNERKRVIKMIQQCLQNLEKKIHEPDDDDHHTSDTE